MITPRISVVLPIYRTGQYLRELHARLVTVLEPLESFELIMVDDGSPDQAWDVVMELAARDDRVKGLRLSRNFGQHPAISAAFDVASGEILVLMDSDLQDRPEEIPLLLQTLQPDIDIVYSVKKGLDESRLTSHLYHHIFSRITRTKVPQNIGTFRVFTRRVLEAILTYPERNILYGPLMFHVGFQFTIVAVDHQPRVGSRSAYSFGQRLNMGLNSLLSYTDLPQRFLIGFGLLVLVLSILYSFVLVGQYLLVGPLLLPGLTVLALLTSMALGATMVGIGVIGLYVFRIYQEVLFRPRYIVARMANLVQGKDRFA